MTLTIPSKLSHIYEPMLDQSAYNYYLKEVLGVGHYIGSPQSQLVTNKGEVSKTLELDSQPLVVVDDELNQTERALLDKIMKAAGKPEFKLETLDNFDKSNLGHRYCLILVNDFNIEQNNFEVFNINKSLVLQSCSLAKFLPPTKDFEIQKNKQLLWKSIQLLFKI